MNKLHTKGIYGNDLIRESFLDLKKAIDNFMPPHVVSGSMPFAKPQAVAKAKRIGFLAKALIEATKAL